jgi:hypothetical protein
MNVDPGITLIFLASAVAVHLFLAFFQASDVKWAPDLNHKQATLWYLFIWLVPFIGIIVARKRFTQPATKASSYYDDSNETVDPF